MIPIIFLGIYTYKVILKKLKRIRLSFDINIFFKIINLLIIFIIFSIYLIFLSYLLSNTSLNDFLETIVNIKFNIDYKLILPAFIMFGIFSYVKKNILNTLFTLIVQNKQEIKKMLLTEIKSIKFLFLKKFLIYLLGVVILFSIIFAFVTINNQNVPNILKKSVDIEYKIDDDTTHMISFFQNSSEFRVNKSYVNISVHEITKRNLFINGGILAIASQDTLNTNIEKIKVCAKNIKPIQNLGIILNYYIDDDGNFNIIVENCTDTNIENCQFKISDNENYLKEHFQTFDDTIEINNFNTNEVKKILEISPKNDDYFSNNKKISIKIDFKYTLSNSFFAKTDSEIIDDLNLNNKQFIINKNDSSKIVSNACNQIFIPQDEPYYEVEIPINENKSNLKMDFNTQKSCEFDLQVIVYLKNNKTFCTKSWTIKNIVYNQE